MKIAVSSVANDLMSNVDPRFGRATFFVIVDSNNMDFRAIENRQSIRQSQGAGIQAAQTVVAERVDVVITGNCGPKANRVLQAAGIQVVTGARGRIDDVVRRYMQNALGASDANKAKGRQMQRRFREGIR